MEELGSLDRGSGADDTTEDIRGRRKGRDRDQGYLDTERWRYQPHQHSGDHGQRALAAGEQAGQVIADVVLCQASPPAQHGPVG